MLGGILTAIGTLCIVALIIYLSYVAARFIARSPLRNGNSRYLRMVDQMPVGQNRAVSVIQVGDRYFLVGIAEKQVSLLAELGEEDLSPLDMGESSIQVPMPNFKEWMRKMGDAAKGRKDKR